VDRGGSGYKRRRNTERKIDAAENWCNGREDMGIPEYQRRDEKCGKNSKLDIRLRLKPATWHRCNKNLAKHKQSGDSEKAKTGFRWGWTNLTYFLGAFSGL
jgi:hypothetical protein